MTIKIRHDRPNVKHNQIIAVGEISKMWKYDMTEEERSYYNNFSKEAREEYKKQYREFRATGVYTKSMKYVKLGNGAGPWVHLLDEERNALEKELASYPTVIFPPRPPNLDEEAGNTMAKNTKKRTRKSHRLMNATEDSEPMILIPESSAEDIKEDFSPNSSDNHVE